MLNRTTTCAAALCAGVLATAALAALPAPARAADDCLTAPKGETPAGAHWYYRLERGTKRKCWYLADETTKAVQPAPKAKATRSTEPAAIDQAVADARAELPPASSEPSSPSADSVWPPMEAAQADAAPAPDQAASAPAADTQERTVAERWPEPGALRDGDSNAEARLQSAAAPASVPASHPAADPVADPNSMRLMFGVLAGALALVAFIVRLIFRSTGGRLRVRTTPPQPVRRAIWDSGTSDDRTAPRPAPVLRSPPPRDLDANDPAREIEDLLLRATRRPAA